MGSNQSRARKDGNAPTICTSKNRPSSNSAGRPRSRGIKHQTANSKKPFQKVSNARAGSLIGYFAKVKTGYDKGTIGKICEATGDTIKINVGTTHFFGVKKKFNRKNVVIAQTLEAVTKKVN